MRGTLHTAIRIAALMLGLVARIAGQEILTNESVINMVKAKIGEDVIIRMIENQPGRYSLTSDSLIKLKQQGVTDGELSAMLKENGGKQPGTLPAVQDALSARQASNQWRVEDQKDEITGQRSLSASPDQEVKSNGRRGIAEVKATCTASLLNFEIAYHGTGDIGFIQQQGSATLHQGLFGSATLDVPPPQVHMRLSVDGKVRTSVSESPHANVASILFTAATPQQGLDQIGAIGSGNRTTRRNPDGSSAQITQNVNQGIAGLATLMVASRSAGTLEEVFGANLIKVELPLANGDAPVLEIHPQDPSFRRFADRCNEERGAPLRAPAPPDGGMWDDQLFAGTPEAFAAAFPGFLQRAAARFQIDPKAYGRQSAYLVNTVRVCSQITPEVAQAITDSSGQVMLSKLTEQQQVCFAPWGAGIPPFDQLNRNWRGISAQFKPQNGWADGFVVEVRFGEKSSDVEPYSSPEWDRTKRSLLGIVTAHIVPTGRAIPTMPPRPVPVGFEFVWNGSGVASLKMYVDDVLIAGLDNKLWRHADNVREFGAGAHRWRAHVAMRAGRGQATPQFLDASGDFTVAAGDRFVISASETQVTLTKR